jgi:uncharacterized protein (DUF952 family)
MADRDLDRLFHIVARNVWDGAVVDGWYRPESLATEGFVHLSYADQVLGVANAFYRDLPGPVVVEFGRASLGSVVVDEDTYGSGQEFPHLYGPLPTSAATAIHPLECDASGRFARTVG